MRAVASGRWAIRAVGLGALLAFGASALAAPAAPPLRFAQVFDRKGEPASLHYRATYTARDTLHRLEVWRDGDRRLVRRTDDAIETHVARTDAVAGYRMVVLDLRRRIETSVTREDLYRIGNFTDWFDLAHGLRYPKGEYTLTALPAASAPTFATAQPCRWYRLEQRSTQTNICWSEREHLPMAMLDGRGRPVWQIEEVSRAKPPADVFQVRDLGYVRNDASHDISGD